MFFKPVEIQEKGLPPAVKIETEQKPTPVVNDDSGVGQPATLW